MKKTVGRIMIATPLFVEIGLSFWWVGFWPTVIIFGGVVILAVWIWAAIALMCSK